MYLMRFLVCAGTYWFACSWFGVQFSREQARKDPDNYFNLRSDMCATQALHSFFPH